MIALITDTHFGCKSFSRPFFLKQMKYFEEEFFPFLLKNKIKNVCHLGDIVHNRNFIDLFIIQEMRNKFFQFFDDNQINFYSLVGNHDSFFKNVIKYNFQNNLKEFEYVKVIDEPQIIKIEGYKIGFIPWICQNLEIDYSKEVDFLCGHFELNNFLMQGNHYSKKGLECNLLERYKFVFSGHYHATSQRNNILYLGAPYQMTWGDYGNKKGFWLLKKNMELKYISNKTSPKFLKLYYAEKKDGKVILKLGGLNKGLKTITLEEALDYSKCNYIKFIIKKYKNSDLMGKYFEELTKNSFDRVDIINEDSIIEDFNMEKFEEDVREDVGMANIIENFVNNLQLDLDKVILLEKMKDLYKKVGV